MEFGLESDRKIIEGRVPRIVRAVIAFTGGFFEGDFFVFVQSCNYDFAFDMLSVNKEFVTSNIFIDLIKLHQLSRRLLTFTHFSFFRERVYKVFRI
jgi:hypothetical protein